MTPEQFTAISRLIRSGQSRSSHAAADVLVHGMAPAEAARLNEITPSSVSDAVSRYRRALAIIESVSWGRAK